MNFYLLVGGLVLATAVMWLVGRWIRLRFTPGGKLNRQLVSWKYGITGKPDYVIYHDSKPIPVLVKSGKAESAPHDTHIAELIVHCLLIEETVNIAPPYGVIRYDDRTFEVDYDDEMFEMLLEVLETMHRDREHLADRPLNRSHDSERRCYACRHCRRCDQSLIK